VPGVALVAPLARTRWHIVYRAAGTQCALRTRGFCQIMPMLARSLSLSLFFSLCFSPCSNVGRVYVPINVSDPSGEEEKRERETRGHSTNARRMRGENNIARFPHTERLRPTRGDGGPRAPRRRRVAEAFGGVFRERESVVISARLDGRSQEVDVVGPPLSHGRSGQPRIGSGFAGGAPVL